MAQQIQLRRDVAADWTAANPTLALGELGVETDTGKFKIGDGSTAWTGLGYFVPSGGAGSGDLLSTNNLSDVADAATALSNLGGQPLDADLTALAAAGNSATLAAVTAAYTTAEASKLAGIEAGADVTDATNVAAAGGLLSSDIGTTVQAYDADTLKADTADTLTAGFDSSDFAAGTKSTGTYTPAASDGNFQVATNGGAHTLAPPSTSCSIVIHYTNNGTAGTITTTGFTAVTGDAFTTTDTHEFVCVVTKINDVSVLNVTALQ